MGKIWDWIDKRTGLGPTVDYILNRRLPTGVTWANTLGSATLFLIFLQVVTGLFLTLYYIPSVEQAYKSILAIEASAFGSIVRGIHHWSANILVVVAFLHLLRVFFWGSYKFPRDLTWILGVVLFILILGLSFTGYLLPWDMTAYWATVVGTEIIGTVPLLGALLKQAALGGEFVGPATLIRFYSLHAMWMPALVVAFTAAHLYLVIFHSISGGINRSLLRTRKEEKGMKFYPDFVKKDVIASGLLLALIMYLAINHGGHVGAPVDTASIDIVPKPEWYFMFLYQFLWFFPGKWEFIGTFIIPVIAIIVLLLLPYIDKGPDRHIFKRPVVVGVGGFIVLSIVYLTVLGVNAPLPMGKKEPFAPSELTMAVQADYEVYNEYGCSACHVINNVGTPVGHELGLDRFVTRSDEFLKDVLTDPAKINPKYKMPAFAEKMSDEDRDSIIRFLRYLDGTGK